MVRILGVVLPDHKRVDYALTILYGVGWSNVKKILEQAKIDKARKMKDLTDEEVKRITEIIEKNYLAEGDLRGELNANIKRLKEIGAYRGLRHFRGLPVRGQRTRSNARTKRGKRKTVGALKKEVWAKMEQAKTSEKKSS